MLNGLLHTVIRIAGTPAILMQPLGLFAVRKQGRSPNREGKSWDLKKIDYSNPAACPTYTRRPHRTTNLLWVSRLENEAVLDLTAGRLKARPDILTAPVRVIQRAIA
jgi:hypothetical protein